MTNPRPGALRRYAVRAAAATTLFAASAAAQAALPTEQIGKTALPPADGQRIYLNDPAMPHILDGRVHVIEGGKMRYAGMIGAGFAAATALSNDQSTLFVATTYFSRLQRGTRTDVVEAYHTSDLTLDYEIEIPAKRAQALQLRALLRQSADGRFLLVQNATPATSITVVDLESRKVAGEISTPGCWGAIPWPQQPRRFSTVCGDGTLATFDLDANGLLASRSVSERFFDPDSDPIFMHFQMVGTRAVFVSYHGTVHVLDLAGEKPNFEATWSMVDPASAKQGWRPGGFQLFAVDAKSGRLFVGMHAKGTEGSHKNPAEQLWVFDLNDRKRLARAPGHGALSMALTPGDRPQLVVLSAADNRLLAFDALAPNGLDRPLRSSAPFGETPVFLEVQ
jgi:methylamine dehydrogenase heavy chain